MRRLLALSIILLFGALAFAGSADASHEKYTIRYIGGGASIGTLLHHCLLTHDETTYALGGSCARPCPHGSCTITVVDDHYGTRTWFRIQVDDEPFFRPQMYYHQTTVEADRVRVAVSQATATIGTITIE
ncbi:MAG: hypothetical protein KY455_14040 [Euryarchaeota archaeon]|nr:hypothetical protein [Euryarchaeota archaeon]